MATTAARSPAGPLVSAFLALLIAIGALQPWITFELPIGDISLASIRGYDTDQGLMALIAGLCGIALGIACAFIKVPDAAYFLGAFVCAAVAIGGALSYWSEINQREGFRVLGQQVKLAETGIGIYLTLGASIVYLISIIWQIVQRLSQKDRVLE